MEKAPLPLSHRAQEILKNIERDAEVWHAKIGKKLLWPTVDALKRARNLSTKTPVLRDQSSIVKQIDPQQVAEAFGTAIAGTRDQK